MSVELVQQQYATSAIAIEKGQGEVIQNVKQNFDLMHDCLQSHWKDA